MELKQYQKRALSDLDIFMGHLRDLKNIPGAYIQTWLENGITVGGDGMPPYQDTIPRVPHVCFKVPTGGGKTVMACASLRHIYDGIEQITAAPVKDKVVVWLVPSDAILEQTLTTLRDANHPYRRQINTDFGGRVEVLDRAQAQNAQNFTPATVRENLTIIVMSFDSLRTKRKEGRKANQENAALEPFVATYEHRETMIADVPENALTQVLNQKSPVVIIDESHNAQSELSVEMIRNLNPSFVLDLTATPKKNSNIISIVDARELKRENMVKLPIVVYNRSSQQEVIDNAIYLRMTMEQRAKALQASGGSYIRPIVLFQAQPKISEDAATFQKLKSLLIDCGIPKEQIAIKTSEINEIKGINLLSSDCPIRYIITVNALKEGWDCPFAYILATLANRTSRVDVEQIVGRVLRLPYTRKHNDPSLNMSYVLTSSNDFMATVSSVVKGLNQAGFTDRDCRAVDTTETSAPAQPAPAAEQIPLQPAPANAPDSPSTEPSQPYEPDDFEFDPAVTRQHMEDNPSNSESPQSDAPLASSPDTPSTNPVADILRDAERQGQQFEQEMENAERSGYTPMGGDEMRHRFEMQSEYEEMASGLSLPIFVRDVSSSAFFEAGLKKLTKESLSDGFSLKDKDIQISFAMSEVDVIKVDIDSESRPRMISIAERQAMQFKELIQSESPEKKRGTITQNIYNQLDRLDFVEAGDLRRYIQRVVDNMTAEELEKVESAFLFYVNRIKTKILELVDEYREKQFFHLIETGEIKLDARWQFPKLITPVPTMMPLSKALYTDEGDVNTFELRVIKLIASLDNVVWWHRNIERHGFCLNGFINHYPDFIVCTASGKIILVETKGDDRDNSDSRKKLKLGRKWADMAGGQYRYYMVFDENGTGLEGAYKFSDFVDLIKHL